MKLVFTGIQGCGKGTQARLLEKKYGYRVLEMWAEFRKVVSSWSELWNTLKSIMESWDQVSGELWRKVMETAIQNCDDENVVYDGFIRNDWNIEVFDSLLPEYQVVLFELSEEKSKQRLLGRMFNPKTGETFMTGMTRDPETWDELVQRADDNEEWILKRIDLYKKITLPIVEEQKKQWKIIEVNADQNVEDVFVELESKLELNDKSDFCDVNFDND